MNALFQNVLDKGLTDILSTLSKTVSELGPRIIQVAELVAETLKKGGKIVFFGNGGSAADSQHLAAEFVNRFRMERRPLPAIALTTDTSILTAIANDYDFNQVFSKQVQALLSSGDLAVGISTSGRSPNVLLALKDAKDIGAKTVAFTGEDTSAVQGICDVVLGVRSKDTPRIQESHIFMGHMICEMVEQLLFCQDEKTEPKEK